MRPAARLATAVVALAAATAPAAAEMKEYQILRMLNFRTECHLMDLKRIDDGKPPLRYFAECGNRTSYPDGLEILCPDPDEEWTCKLLTEKKNFQNLDMLRQPD